jgi:hypothetical protein
MRGLRAGGRGTRRYRWIGIMKARVRSIEVLRIRSLEVGKLKLCPN